MLITNKVLRPGRPWHRKKRNLKKVYQGGMPIGAFFKMLKIPKHELESKRVKEGVKYALDNFHTEHVADVYVDSSLPQHEQLKIVAKVARSFV